MKDREPRASRLYSRRDFLKKLPLGLAGVAAVGALSGRLLFRRRRRAPTFPPGSIFTPAKDPRSQA